MKFKVDILSLQKAIKFLGVVVKINALDASGIVLVEAKDNIVNFSAHNGSTGISFRVPTIEMKEEGETAVAYSKIKTFVASFKPWDGSVGVKEFVFSSAEKTTSITVDNIYISGKSTKGKLRLSNFNPAIVTKLPPFSQQSFTLNSTIFKAATDKVLYAINPNADFDFPALQGMNVLFDKNNISFAGSDGIVLSEYQVKNVSNYTGDNIIIHYDFLMGLRRLTTDDTPILWEIKDRRVTVKFDEVLYSGRLIIGSEYPDYKPTFDKYETYINLSKDFLMGSLYPFTDVLDAEDYNRITFKIKDGVLKIYNDNLSFESDQDIPIGTELDIDLNGKLLIQTIDSIKDDFILFKFSDADGFAIFDSSSFNDQKALMTPIKKR